MTTTNDQPLATPLMTSSSLYHEEYRPPFLPVLALVPFLLPVFWTYSVTVTKDGEELTFGYSWNMARKTVTVDQISSATIVPDIRGLREWGGWGIRTNLWGFDTGYIAKNGPGVRIEVQRKGKKKDAVYVFNCEDPEIMCKLLKNDAQEN